MRKVDSMVNGWKVWMFALAAASCMVACSGSDSSGAFASSSTETPSSCPQPAGGYEATFVKQGGSCGDLSPRVMLLNAPSSGCTTDYQRYTPTDDGCTVEERDLCTSNDGTVATTQTYVVDLTTDVRSLHGTVTLDARSLDGSQKSCSATYSLTLIAQ